MDSETFCFFMAGLTVYVLQLMGAYISNRSFGKDLLWSFPLIAPFTIYFFFKKLLKL